MPKHFFFDVDKTLTPRDIELLKADVAEFSAVGIIPVSMARWQLTGRNEDIMRVMDPD